MPGTDSWSIRLGEEENRVYVSLGGDVKKAELVPAREGEATGSNYVLHAVPLDSFLQYYLLVLDDGSEYRIDVERALYEDGNIHPTRLWLLADDEPVGYKGEFTPKKQRKIEAELKRRFGEDVKNGM